VEEYQIVPPIPKPKNLSLFNRLGDAHGISVVCGYDLVTVFFAGLKSGN
jgi:hypothetical protein